VVDQHLYRHPLQLVRKLKGEVVSCLAGVRDADLGVEAML
jgi:hypothetical protein